MYNLRPRKKLLKPVYVSGDSPPMSDDESDKDYDPDETEYEESIGSECDSEDFDIDIADLGRNYRMGSSAPSSVAFVGPVLGYNAEEKEYLARLKVPERRKFEELEKQLGDSIAKDLIPLRFRILQAPMDDAIKRHVLHKLNQFAPMNDSSGEYFKLKNWLENVSRLPFGRYANLPVNHVDGVEKVGAFMENTRTILEETVYGHQETKLQIMRVVAQWISNPASYGHAIGIHGPPGVGKTQLIKYGLSKALGIPFGFIPLGGCSDGSFLEGHSYTYEGSTYGKIAEVLIKTQCSNPILFFDELDKVSLTKKGEEIIGILTHLTDPTQNDRFADKYFTDIDLNLSRSLMIFSYNDESLINPILKDRLITIKVEGYKKGEKRVIARDYLLPEICKAFGFGLGDIVIEDGVLDYLIEVVAEEKGVRNLKRGLECVVSWINMERWQPGKEMVLPYCVSREFIEKHIRRREGESGPPGMYL